MSGAAFLCGDFDRAREESSRSLESFRITNQNLLKALSLTWLGLLACVDGNYVQARQDYEQARQLDSSPRHLFYLNWLLALAACGLDDYETARHASHEALSISNQYGALARITWCLPPLAMIEVHRGNDAQAVHLLSLAFHHPKSATGWLEKWPVIQQLQDELAARLGADDYTVAWEQGKTLDLEQVVSDWLLANG
jgi:tetratricopeptide (TPR) repeat protein